MTQARCGRRAGLRREISFVRPLKESEKPIYRIIVVLCLSKRPIFRHFDISGKTDMKSRRKGGLGRGPGLTLVNPSEVSEVPETDTKSGRGCVRKAVR